MVVELREDYEIEELRKENTLLWQANTHLQQKLAEQDQEVSYLRNQLDFHRDWRKQLDRVEQEVLTSGEKSTVAAIYKMIRDKEITPNADGYYYVEPWRIGEATGYSAASTRGHINNVADIHEDGKPDKLAIVPLFDKRLVRIPNENAEAGHTEATYLKPLAPLAYPLDYRHVARKLRSIGGAGRGQGRKTKCETCGGQLQEKERIIDMQTYTLCPRCHTTHVFPVQHINDPLPVTDPDGGNQVDFGDDHEENGNQLDAVDSLFILNQVDFSSAEAVAIAAEDGNQLDFEGEQEAAENPITTHTTGEVSADNFLLETWLARRIGNVPHQFIKATGKLKASEKYISLAKGYTPDIAAYLHGALHHIYGSIPLNTDGTTYLLSFDCDTTERALRKNDILRMLANAGASPICWQRRPGRWHLEIYFDAPVNAQAAYQWAIEACSLLAEFEECYPVKGIEDKSNQRLSWPLWYRVDNTVIECAAAALFPGMDKPIISDGVQSDRERLIVLVAQAVTPAALIPVLPMVTQEVPERTAQCVVLLEKPTLPSPVAVGMSDSDVAKAAIKAWNNEHTWEQIADVQNGRFLASWRKERTPSVVIDQDGERACDYGNHGNWPKKVDRFEAWCLIEKRDKKAEIAKLCAEYRAQAQEVA